MMSQSTSALQLVAHVYDANTQTWERFDIERIDGEDTLNLVDGHDNYLALGSSMQIKSELRNRTRNKQIMEILLEGRSQAGPISDVTLFQAGGAMIALPRPQRVRQNVSGHFELREN